MKQFLYVSMSVKVLIEDVGHHLRLPLDIQVPESRAGGLIDRSEGGSLEVRVEIEGRVWLD